MTQDEIIEMARQADREWDCDRDMYEWLEWFAKLAYEKGRLAGIQQERALNNLSETSQQIGYDK